MAEPNPFAALLPTTQNTMGRRQAEFAAMPGDSFWAAQAGMAGLNARRQLMEQGIALSPEDERAIATDKIMAGSQKRLAELVRSGEVDPLDAQEAVINETMSAFMRAGDYQAAQSLLPGLNQIRTYRGELDKLRSEQTENLAQADQALAAGGLSDTRGRVLEAESPSKIRLNLARAGQADRSPAARAGGTGAGGGADDQVKILGSEQAEVRASFHGTKNALSLLSDLSTVMKVAPGAASVAGQAANTGGQFLSGVRNWMAGRGSVSAADIENLDSEHKAIVDENMRVGRANRAVQAQSLGMSVTQYESLVVEVAYALARVNDPGGRLSNNDFDYALKQLGAVQDAKSALAAFSSIAKRATRSFKTRLEAYTPERRKALEFDILERQIDEAHGTFDKQWGGNTISDIAEGTGRQQELRNKYVPKQ